MEIILGIDNVVFIAILADKLPPKQRDRARVIGLSLALIMRLCMLSLISWIVTLRRPIFSNFLFSSCDLILILGGIFLLFKATTELHERLENKEHDSNVDRGYTSFWSVVMQIVMFDAIFFLDAVITAIGMVNNLTVMMTAVVIAMSIMLLASRSLTNFINRHQTVVVLCLSFLLMIGLSLIAEGFNCHIPKSYLGFSIFIEMFNQIARRNVIKNQSAKPIRERTAEAIMRLMWGRGQREDIDEDDSSHVFKPTHFADEERHMISSVLSLSSRTLRSVMTPRNEITWLNCQCSIQALRATLIKTPHNMFPVCNGELDKLIGIVRAKDLMASLDLGINVQTYAAKNPAIVVSDTLDVLKLLQALRRAKGSIVIVSNASNVIQGLVTPLDLLGAIAGEFSNENNISELNKNDITKSEVNNNNELVKNNIR